MQSWHFLRGRQWRKSGRAEMAAALICVALLAGCSDTEKLEIWRQIPIQMARATQTDSYKQIFQLDPGNGGSLESISAEARGAFDKRMDLIFTKLIGSRNWQHMKNLYGVNSIREELFARQIHMEGLVSFSTYLDPLDHDYVIMEGSGRFFAVRKKTGIIMMSGDFHVTPQRYRIHKLRKGCIPMEVVTYTTRIPGKPTYYNNTVIHYDLRIKTVGDEKKAFSVDYDSQHEAFLDLNSNDKYETNELIGTMQLNGRYSQAKLLDLNGIEFIRKAYDFDDNTLLQAAQAASVDKGKSCVR